MQFFKQAFLMFLCFSTFVGGINAQNIDYSKQAKAFINQNHQNFGLVLEDVQNVRVSTKTFDQKSEITRYYFNQMVNGVEVYNAIWPVMVKNESTILGARPTFVQNAKVKANSSVASLDMYQALQMTVEGLGLTYEKPNVKETRTNGIVILEKPSFSYSDVLVNKVYFEKDAQLFLAWQLDIEAKGNKDYLSLIVDAQNGQILDTKSYTVHCTFETNGGSYLGSDSHVGHKHKIEAKNTKAVNEKANADFEEVSAYHILPIPAESPIHGDLETVISPWDPAASPFGWHDTDGSEGAEFTITRGNNVHAYLDVNNNNGPNVAFPEPDGGAMLNFVFPVDLTDEPDSYRDAATTNLFYMVNIMHDFTNAYGFDEVSGNFQQNNYSGSGNEGDYVFAEAQDGSGTNNANFSTPQDGGNGRMQMFTWDRSAGSQDLMTVNSPDDISGTYATGSAGFGLPVTEDNPITAEVAQALDASSSPTLVCGNIVNGEELVDKIAMIDRGTCEFGSKALKAQNEGAIGVIICNYENAIVGMAGGNDGGSVTIPVVSLSSSDCTSLKNFLDQGVSITLQAPPTADADLYDADYDNGVIAHEFGHGVSNRLIGGPVSAGCLGSGVDAQGNADGEQMGEGWSDFFALVTCTEAGAQGSDKRGIGTWVSREETNGNGIRPYPYSTDMAINPVTYDYVLGLSVPHGVGSVWNSMIWDLYWAMVEAHGWNDDQIYGDGGNNRAIFLVMDGMKNSSCQPTFTDARDGILAADQLLYDGENQCLIWEVFARRGLGVSADAGAYLTRFDGTEAYDVPESCITELKVRKSVTPNVLAGTYINVSLNVINHSGEDAANVIVEDQILDGQTPKMGSGSQPFTIVGDKVQFTIPALAQNESLELTYTMETVVAADKMSNSQLFDDIEAGDELFEAEFLVGNSAFDYEDLGGNFAHSGIYSWTVFSSENRNDQAVTMVDEITLPTGQPTLRFWQKYDTEPGADGGVVQVSTDGGTIWEFLPKEAFFRDGYRGRMQGNAFFAVDVWAFWGPKDVWHETYADLSAYAGQDVKIRFRFATDDNVAIGGWSIDDIEITDMFNYNSEVCVSADGVDANCYMAEGKGTFVEFNDGVDVDEADLLDLGYIVSPNPNNGQFTIQIEDQDYKDGLIEVYSVSGKLIHAESFGTARVIEVELDDLAQGAYVLKVKTDKAVGITKLIID